MAIFWRLLTFLRPYRAGVVWSLLLATAAAWLRMDNLATVTSSPREQMRVVRQRETWLLSVLYIGTFGSFIGYSAALPLLIKLYSPDVAGLVLKSIYVPDARFTLPGYSGQAGLRMRER